MVFVRCGAYHPLGRDSRETALSAVKIVINAKSVIVNVLGTYI